MGVRVRCRNESLSQWMSKTSPRPKKARQVRSHVKVLLTVFFDSEGVVHYEFLPQGRTVNKEYYLEVMHRLREAVRKKRPDAWWENQWMLQHYNMPSHSLFLVRDFLAKHATTVLPQPLYSPNLTPADFFLFPKLKSTLKGRRFESIEPIKTNLLAHLRSIPKTAFQECFRTLKKRWQRCIHSRGEYFEGDKRLNSFKVRLENIYAIYSGIFRTDLVCVFHLSEDTLNPNLFFQEQYNNVIWVMNTNCWGTDWFIFHWMHSLNCYNVTNKCAYFFRITIKFQYANSNMSWVLLAHHQGVHSCTKQSSNPSIIPSMQNCAKFISV